MLEESKLIHIHISEDEMVAYLAMDEPPSGEEYTVEQLEKELRDKGVVYGVNTELLQQMIDEKLYRRERTVAVGEPPEDGIDGSYEYNFRQVIDKKPRIREDGTVDYWSMNLIETVVEGQVIAIYKPAVQGKNGVTVKGKQVLAKIGKELSPLKGRGFERNNDNLTYVASMDGRIDMIEGRINISHLHEIHGNVDINLGNIDFAGDVVIHGNVCVGATVRAGGTVTIDGLVENARIWAGKDVVLRNGVIGDEGAEIFSRGDIYARFLEYAKVEALGNIQADTILRCEVECKQKLLLEGKKGVIIGGQVHAIRGIEANEIGNDSEVPTVIEVGVGEMVYAKIKELQRELLQLEAETEKVDEGLKQLDNIMKKHGVKKGNEEIRAKLLRIRIRNISAEKEKRAELEELLVQEEEGREATVKVNRAIYPGTTVQIGYAKTHVKEEQLAVEYVKRGDTIVLKGEAIVE